MRKELACSAYKSCSAVWTEYKRWLAFFVENFTRLLPVWEPCEQLQLPFATIGDVRTSTLWMSVKWSDCRRRSSSIISKVGVSLMSLLWTLYLTPQCPLANVSERRIAISDSWWSFCTDCSLALWICLDLWQHLFASSWFSLLPLPLCLFVLLLCLTPHGYCVSVPSSFLVSVFLVDPC